MLENYLIIGIGNYYFYDEDDHILAKSTGLQKEISSRNCTDVGTSLNLIGVFVQDKLLKNINKVKKIVRRYQYASQNDTSEILECSEIIKTFKIESYKLVGRKDDCVKLNLKIAVWDKIEQYDNKKFYHDIASTKINDLMYLTMIYDELDLEDKKKIKENFIKLAYQIFDKEIRAGQGNMLFHKMDSVDEFLDTITNGVYKKVKKEEKNKTETTVHISSTQLRNLSRDEFIDNMKDVAKIQID